LAVAEAVDEAPPCRAALISSSALVRSVTPEASGEVAAEAVALAEVVDSGVAAAVEVEDVGLLAPCSRASTASATSVSALVRSVNAVASGEVAAEAVALAEVVDSGVAALDVVEALDEDVCREVKKFSRSLLKAAAGEGARENPAPSAPRKGLKEEPAAEAVEFAVRDCSAFSRFCSAWSAEFVEFVERVIVCPFAAVAWRSSSADAGSAVFTGKVAVTVPRWLASGARQKPQPGGLQRAVGVQVVVEGAGGQAAELAADLGDRPRLVGHQVLGEA